MCRKALSAIRKKRSKQAKRSVVWWIDYCTIICVITKIVAVFFTVCQVLNMPAPLLIFRFSAKCVSAYMKLAEARELARSSLNSQLESFVSTEFAALNFSPKCNTNE